MNLIIQNSLKPKWKLIEEIVAILEKSLTPDVKVEHNVRLPVIGGSRKRQCDVVITYGKHPNQSITIVEVQTRKNKPEIALFDGWIAKMKEVGAQGLICVSAVGYPKSIIEKVKLKYGSIVRLLTLEELQKIKIGNMIFSFNSALELKPKFSFKLIGSVKLENPPLDKSLKFTNHDRIFEIDNESNFLSLDDLISKCLNEISFVARSKGVSDLGSGVVKVMLGSVAKNLLIHSGGQRFKILNLPIEVEVNTQRSKIPVNYYEYKQKDVSKPLAWIAQLENKGTIVFSSSSKESSEAIKTQPPNVQLSGVVLKAEISLTSGISKQII